MEYKHIQTTTALRNQNGIKAYKILDIQNGGLIFQLWLNSDKQGRLTVPGEWQKGEYVDLIVVKTGRTSYTVKLIGRTPKKFIPAAGQNIAV